MADGPQYTKGSNTQPGQGEQLPQGEASQLNEGAAQAKKNASDLAGQNQAGPADQYQPAPVAFSEPPKDSTPAMPTGEDDQMLFGPTERPVEPITAGRAPVGYQPPPKDIGSWLPTLQEAAADPNAPESIKNLFKLVVYHMNQGQ